MNATSKTPASSNVTPTSIRVDGARLWQSLMDLAQIGATPKGGVRRLALTDLDRQGRDLVVGWLRDAGASTEIDGAGNVFAVRRGRDDAAPVVLTGSHVDTQPSGGKFDGNYGVLAGLEVLRTLNDAGVVTRKPVGVAIWTNEEGTRFVPTCRRACGRRILRSAYRAGTHSRTGRHSDRRGDGCAGSALVRLHLDGSGCARRADADGGAS